jgi:hypothetical protein
MVRLGNARKVSARPWFGYVRCRYCCYRVVDLDSDPDSITSLDLGLDPVQVARKKKENYRYLYCSTFHGSFS